MSLKSRIQYLLDNPNSPTGIVWILGIACVAALIIGIWFAFCFPKKVRRMYHKSEWWKIALMSIIGSIVFTWAILNLILGG